MAVTLTSSGTFVLVPPAKLETMTQDVATLTRSSWLFDAKRDSSAFSPDRAHVYSFDLEGRPISWFEGGRLYKRSLASHVYGRESGSGERRRWQLPDDEATKAFARVLQRARDASMQGPGPAMLERLSCILSWTPERLMAERARFGSVYEPISILPPDQYGAIVLQATFGCSWNRCTFCNFYQDRPFRTKSAEAFKMHAEGVKALLGEGAALRKSLFLADGNALILSNSKLQPLIEIAKAVFPARKLYGFVDVFTGEKKPLEDWAELASLGLERVYIGLETGHDPLLAWLNKPGSARDAEAFIRTLKDAGLQVSVIIMVGAGGTVLAESHERDTLELLERLPLERGDLVYLSPFVEHPASRYAAEAAALGTCALTPQVRQGQLQRLRENVKRAHPDVKVARYEIAEFIY